MCEWVIMPREKIQSKNGKYLREFSSLKNESQNEPAAL